MGGKGKHRYSFYCKSEGRRQKVSLVVWSTIALGEPGKQWACMCSRSKTENNGGDVKSSLQPMTALTLPPSASSGTREAEAGAVASHGALRVGLQAIDAVTELLYFVGLGHLVIRSPRSLGFNIRLLHPVGNISNKSISNQ